MKHRAWSFRVQNFLPESHLPAGVAFQASFQRYFSTLGLHTLLRVSGFSVSPKRRPTPDLNSTKNTCATKPTASLRPIFCSVVILGEGVMPLKNSTTKQGLSFILESDNSAFSCTADFYWVVIKDKHVGWRICVVETGFFLLSAEWTSWPSFSSLLPTAMMGVCLGHPAGRRTPYRIISSCWWCLLLLCSNWISVLVRQSEWGLPCDIRV